MAEWARLEGTATSKCNGTRTRAVSPAGKDGRCGCSSGLGVALSAASRGRRTSEKPSKPEKPPRVPGAWGLGFKRFISSAKYLLLGWRWVVKIIKP